MPEDPKSYTAVLYFHGIGSPKRHVSLSQFLDYFDRFGQSQDKHGVGRPRDFEYGVEAIEDDVVNFVSFKRVVDFKNSPKISKRIRVYEGYWVPEAGSRASFLYICMWLLKRVINPFLVTLSSWRSYPALRLAALHRLAGSEMGQARAQRLERLYRDFENWESREAYPRGKFHEFINLVRSALPQDEAAARVWRKNFLKYNSKIILYFVAILSCIMLYILLFVHSSYQVYLNIYSYSPNEKILSKIIYHLIFVFGIFSFLYMYVQGRNYVFDVVSWTADAESGERYAARGRVLRYAQHLIRHIASDPYCSECIVIGHSLGTSIATEALLREGVRATARRSLDSGAALEALAKIKTVFTIGSPIDRIFYLFQVDSSFSHRYSRLFEEQRLSLELPPFSYATKKSETKIVNFWSRFDPISSSIISIRKNVSDRRDAIQNREALPSKFPFPIGSHTSYFSDRSVIKPIYWSIMTGKLPKYFEDNPNKIEGIGFGRGVTTMSALLTLASLALLVVNCRPFVALGLLGIWWIGFTVWQKNVRRRYERHGGEFLRR